MYGDGGFVNSANNGQNSGFKKGDREKVNDTITPMLISWLTNASAKHSDDVVRIDGAVLDKAKIVGRLISHQSKGTKTIVKIEDGSDVIELSCNKKFDEEIPRVLSLIDLNKSLN